MADESLYLLLACGISIMVLLVLSVLLIFNVSKRRILSEISEKQEKELEFQQNMLRNSIETQEKERSRIAQELHDDIGSKLNVVNLNFNLLETSIEKGGSTIEPIDQIRTLLQESIVRVRDLSHGLYPPILEKFGIQSALESFAIEVNRTGQIIIALDIVQDWGKMDINKELNIYRIFQELVSNTIKHAKAKNINLTSSAVDGKLLLVYTDDGIGLQENDSMSHGMGMQNIKTRVSLLQADMSIENQVSGGIRVSILLPKN